MIDIGKFRRINHLVDLLVDFGLGVVMKIHKLEIGTIEIDIRELIIILGIIVALITRHT